jgi:hypothetical protein
VSTATKRQPSPEIVARMREYRANKWRWHDGTCRFCGYLAGARRCLKYGTRHYACAECVNGILLRADLAAAEKFGKEKITINPYPDSALAQKMAPQVRVLPGERPVTRDCYGAHTISWAGGATPKRKPAP